MRSLRHLLSRVFCGPPHRTNHVPAGHPAPPNARIIDFRQLAENSIDIICQMDAYNQPVYVSPSVETMLGWTPEEMILAGPTFIHPDDAALVESAHDRLIAGEIETATVSLRLLNRDGAPIWVEANARLMRDADGNAGDVVIVMRDITDRKKLEDELRALSLTDGLTNLHNRRALDEALKREWNRAMRDGSQMSLLLLDIDHFKRFNDRYGHQAGDECLRKVAGAIKHIAQRPGDFVARYGGEEIAIILPDTDAGGAATVAEAIRAGVERLKIHRGGGVSDRVTITASIGAATALADQPCTMRMPEGLVRAADHALYEAKQGGRNRVVMCGGDGTAALHPGLALS